MTSVYSRAPNPHYRPYIQPSRPVADVRDDYERWYTETVPNNRMSLSLRSGIHSEVGWALDRLCRLCHNEQFVFTSIPGVIDGLFDWPEWYVTEGYKQATDMHILFSPPPEQARQRRYALESLFVLRNAALHEQNAWELAHHSHTLPLILNGMHNLDFTRDENAEVVLHIVEIFHVVASKLVITSSTHQLSNPLPPLIKMVSQSPNRTLIMASLNALTALISNSANASQLLATSPALEATLKYLPLFIDPQLNEACLNYLYAHISHPPMARAFLLHPEMPNVLKLLVSLILHEQAQLEEKVVVDISGPIHTVPSATLMTKDHELCKEELDGLLDKPEPQRCYDWMRTMFIAKSDSELTQVDFWNLYKDVFAPYQDKYPLLVAADVIKYVTSVFPQAQAMVLPGPVQRFVVRGVDRRKESTVNELFKCQWDRSQCAVAALSSPGELFEHVLDHLATVDASQFPCLWGSCSQQPLPKQALRAHILTHLSISQPAQKHSSQSETITLSSSNDIHPTDTPTKRQPPPPRSTMITYQRPMLDPPTTSLTALLIIRILFRTSFASTEAAPRVDADHFGFPGLLEEPDEQESADIVDGSMLDSEREGERKGRKAFARLQKFLEHIRIRDDVLMGWIAEMIHAFNYFIMAFARGLSLEVDMTRRPSSQITPKIVGLYTRFFNGLTPEQISPHQTREQLFSEILDLPVNRPFLQSQLVCASKDSCLESIKPFLNALVKSCLKLARTSPYEDIKKANAVETLSIVIRHVLAKSLTGWEVMEVLAGSVGQSDVVFMDLATLISDALADLNAPARFRHQVLQLALTYMCSVSQLSPGAYLLRKDLFPSIATFIKSSDTEEYTFEAMLLLATLANYHKSDAAKLNPYLTRIRETKDEDLLRKMCWASNFALQAVAKAYQEISDDSVTPTLTSSFSSIISLLRPDRALSTTPVDPPREIFKDQPIEACVILLSLYEFIRANSTFSSILLDYATASDHEPQRPLPFTIITMSSYLLTHASSTSSPRSIAYANLSLNVLLAFVEDEQLMGVFCEPSQASIRLCRQRVPLLSIPRTRRPPICAIVDCCVLWLRHNLQKRLDVSSYMICIWICHRIIWFLQSHNIRLEYEWIELWTSVVSMLTFLINKLESLNTSGGVNLLIGATLQFLDLALFKSEAYLPTPHALHEFIYELTRGSASLKKLEPLLEKLAISETRPHVQDAKKNINALSSILEAVQYYGGRVIEGSTGRTAKEAMGTVAKEIETNGLRGARDGQEAELARRSGDVLGFARFACLDGLALMP